MKKQIINIDNIGYPEDYFKLDLEAREKLCSNIIQQVTEKVKFSPDIITTYTYMDEMLERSIVYYNENEQYEISQLYTDIRKAIQTEIEKLKET